MPVIKLPEADWGEAWRLLIQEGGTTRISKDHVYIVSGRQIELLQDRQLPFEALDESDRHSVRDLSTPTV
jgi:hypothetical protein